MRGSLPAQDWQIDFTHMPRVQRVRYLLVLVDTFSRWVETFPTTNKRAHTVAQIILTEIIPRFVLPSSLQSDNGPEFTSKVTQQLVQFLQIPWKFHIPYCPQSSGKVERMNRIIKETLTKLTLEVHLDWTKLLPIVLLRIRALPRKPLGLSLFEVMYGRPMLRPGLHHEPPPIPSFLHSPLLAQLRNALWRYINHNLPAPDHQASLPPLQIGDMVYLSDHPQGDLTPQWQGPFKVILLAPTAAKLGKVTSWVHLSCLKRVTPNPALPSLNDTYQVSFTAPTSIKFTRQQPLSTIGEDTE